jgi:hypothetical protein
MGKHFTLIFHVSTNAILIPGFGIPFTILMTLWVSPSDIVSSYNHCETFFGRLSTDGNGVLNLLFYYSTYHILFLSILFPDPAPELRGHIFSIVLTCHAELQNTCQNAMLYRKKDLYET